MKFPRHWLRSGWVLPTAAALVAAGCIVSGQFVIVVDVDGDILTTSTAMGHIVVDLTSNSTWKDHKDDIQSIVDVKFEARFVNNRSDSASGEVWISAADNPIYTDVDSMEAHSTKILSGIPIPGSKHTDVSFRGSAAYISNLDVALDMLESGKFTLYGIALTLPFDVTITGVPSAPHARLLVTLSAG